MIHKVYEILSTLKLPTKWLIAPDFGHHNIVISYHFFNEADLLHGDGQATEEGGALQVDIFSKVDYTNVTQEVKELLKKAHFLLEDARDDIEEIDNHTIIYHKILIFNYIKSEVMRNG